MGKKGTRETDGVVAWPIAGSRAMRIDRRRSGSAIRLAVYGAIEVQVDDSCELDVGVYDCAIERELWARREKTRRSRRRARRLAKRRQMGTASCTPTELAIGEWRQPNASSPTRRANPTQESFTKAREETATRRTSTGGRRTRLHSLLEHYPVAEPKRSSISNTSNARNKAQRTRSSD